MKGIRVYPIDTATGPVPACQRRDLYTICLLTGPRQLQCADQKIELDGPCLFFGAPPGVGVATRHTGYGCRFTEAFVQAGGQVGRQEEWALLHGRGTCAFSLHEEQAVYLASLFRQMLAEQQTTYRFKHELLRSYLQLILHEALRLRAPKPKPFFRYYFQAPEPASQLGCGWRSRQRLIA